MTLRKAESEALQQHKREQEAYELYWRGRIFRALRRQTKAFTTAARSNGLLASMVGINLLVKPDAIEKVLMRLYKQIIPREGEKFRKLYDAQKGFGELSVPWFQSIEDWMGLWWPDMITNMNDVTKKQILKFITDGIEAGDGYNQIIDEIENAGTERKRAALIARTETNRSLGFAKYEAIARLPYLADVVWISTRDKRTRGAVGDDKSDHYHLNGVVVPYLVPFTDPRNNAKLLFPGDVSQGAGARDVCNCRCTIAARRRV